MTKSPAATDTLPEGRQVVVTEFAESPAEAIEKFIEIRTQPAPDPLALGPHEVLIGIRSAAISWVDLLMTSGQYQHMPDPPYTPGMEYAGDVLAVGAAVTAPHCVPGGRVMADPFRAGPRSSGPYKAVGGLSSYAVLPEEAVLPVPEGMSYDAAAALLQAYETAYHCLVVRGQVQPGEWVLINGATGLTGLAAVSLAKMLGSKVIATGRTAAKLEAALEAGADHAVTVLDETGAVRRFRDEVKALAGGRGVDVVYDAVGGDVSLESLRCTGFGARFLIVGWTSTPDVARGKGLRGAPKANMLPTNIIQMKGLSILGSPAAIAASVDPSIRTERLATILKWAGEGRIAPHISHRYPLEEVHSALTARWRGEISGACILHP